MVSCDFAEGKSKVWSHFTKDSTGARCKICSVQVSQGSSTCKSKNTTNLWQHLKLNHKEVFDDAQAKMAQVKAPKPQPAQCTIVQAFDKGTKWAPSDQRSKDMDKLIMEMIATDILPYSVVEGIGFKRLLAKAEQRYQIKSEKYYCTQLMSEIYTKVVGKIKELLSEDNAGNCISFTTDCWSGSTKALMSLTAHFIDQHWKRIQLVLNVKAMSGSHTGEYISQVFLTMLQEWEIDAERVHLVLRDSGANVVKGMRMAQIPDLSCTAHTLQLRVNNGLNAQRMVGDMLAKMKKIATHFNHSVVAQQRLSAIQEEGGVPRHSILQAVSTRWNSTLHMLSRMLEQKRAITTYSSDHEHFVCPTAEEWDVAANLVETLTPLEEVSNELSKAGASASCIIPNISVLKQLLMSEGPTSRGIQTLRKTMLESLAKRFAKVMGSKQVVLACLLDPRYKECPLSTKTLAQAKAWLTEDAGIEDEGSPKRKRTGSLLDSLFDEMLSPSGKEEAPKGILEELDTYLHEPVLDRRRGDPLKWWNENSKRFQGLSVQARRYLSCAPSSVPSERVFSTIGNIYDDKRSSLKGENAENLCFLHYNLPLLNWRH
ncbi:zinc finger BED domain-containing protein 4-like [Sphaeramia orbicularis]|uniref:zinc finger BED domain-containing protein 4-like n=1 Tax=Sphaeramia orbicularis TaxID=375764 RepID=UPI00117F6177|nr:zinc finger BED domain-containing protein 4-like [Sphaeramia orbicularis]